MIPARHFAGRGPVTPPTSDSESETKSDSDAEPIRPAPVSRRRRFVARVVERPKLDEQTSAGAPKAAKGFIPLKAIQQNTTPETQRPEQAQERAESPLPDHSPPDNASHSSSSNSSESESERSPSPPRQPPPRASFKPVFIKSTSKEAPDTSRQESRALERKEEARQLVSAALREEEASRRIERHIDLPDDTDHERDRPREEALWRVREMRRILRDREAEKAWRNRGMADKLTYDKYSVEKNGRKDAKETVEERQAGESKTQVASGRKVGPFFIERGEDGRLTEDIYNRDLQEGRGGISGLRVGRDGGRSGRTKFTGLANEDTAGEMARELKRDRELAATLEAARRK